MSGQLSGERHRFVILQHDHPFLHWDLLLARGESAATWRLMNLPAVGVEIRAERVADHRLYYLGYEGPISGGRGTVNRIASGTYLGEISDHAGFEVLLFDTRLAARARLQIDRQEQCIWRFYG